MSLWYPWNALSIKLVFSSFRRKSQNLNTNLYEKPGNVTRKTSGKCFEYRRAANFLGLSVVRVKSSNCICPCLFTNLKKSISSPDQWTTNSLFQADKAFFVLRFWFNCNFSTAVVRDSTWSIRFTILTLCLNSICYWN